MKVISNNIPHELNNRQIHSDVIYSRSTDGKNDYKNVDVELDEDGKKIVDYRCTCKVNTINDSMNKPQTKCKHIKKAVWLIYNEEQISGKVMLDFVGRKYVEDEIKKLQDLLNEETITNIKPKDL